MKWHNLQDVLREMIDKKGEIKIETPNGDIYTIKEIDGVFKPVTKASDIGKDGDVFNFKLMKWQRKIEEEEEELHSEFNSMLGIDRGCENIQFIDLDGSLYEFDKDKLGFFLKETQDKEKSKIEYDPPQFIEYPPSLPLTKEKKEMLLKAINTLLSKEKRLILNLEGDTIEEMSLKNKEIFKFISENLCKDYEKLKKEIEDIKL